MASEMSAAVPESDYKYHRHLQEVNSQQQGRHVVLALIGAGRIGSMHLGNMVRNPLVDLAYVVDPDEKRREVAKIKWQLRDDQILDLSEADKVWNDPRVQAVVVATPTRSHEEVVVKALKAGKSVLCEKPVALSHESVQRCYQQAAQSRLVLLCAFNRRFDPTFRLMRSKTQSGEVGKVLSMRSCSRDSPLPTMEYLSTSGGIFHDCAVHDLDVLCWILGQRPTSVFASASVHHEGIARLGDVDVVAIVLKFPDGTLANIDISRHSSYGYDQRIEIFGSRGLLLSNLERPMAMEQLSSTGTTKVPTYYSFQSRYSDAYCMELEHFIQAVQGQEEQQVTCADALAAFKLAEACEKSLATGSQVEVNWDESS